jgi:hypothetical protein
MTTYAKLTENNEWEGEVWCLYIPIEGNEKVLDQLDLALGEQDSDESGCTLDLNPISESEVDILVKHGGDTTYMDTHNKLSGTLTLTDEILEQISDGGDDDPLYKGGIREFMRDADSPEGQPA